MAKAIILAGGVGSRMKNTPMPKQYMQIQGRSVISYVIETCFKCTEIESICIVADMKWCELIMFETLAFKTQGLPEKPIIFSKPGETRQESVIHGLVDLKESTKADDIVAILDAARPNTSVELLTAVINAAKDHDGAMPVLLMKDTIYYQREDRTLSNIDRSSLLAGQSPEAFKFEKYLYANAALYPDKIKAIYGSSQPMLMLHCDIVTIPGDENNFKITTDEDLERFRAIAEERHEKSIKKVDIKFD